MIPAKINPSKYERRMKLYRAALYHFWMENRMPLVMILNIVWLYLFCFEVLRMR